VHRLSVTALFLEWGVILAVAAAATTWWSVWIALPAALVLATRQHALFVLYHDAVHGLIAQNRRLNDFLINTAVGVPLLLPVHLYRALHISHHRHLGSRYDPERVLLYRGQPWNYRPLATAALAAQLAGDLLGWNAGVLAWRYLVERRRGGSLRLSRTRAYPELAVQFVLFAAPWAGGAILWPMATLHLAALWFLPYLTLTQVLQKVRSFAEHTDEDDPAARSCSWAPGLVGRLTIWPYNINYHREHHARPNLPWDRLPAVFPAARQRQGAELRSHLWSGSPP
jgi:fatty acid desaturase